MPRWLCAEAARGQMSWLRCWRQRAGGAADCVLPAEAALQLGAAPPLQPGPGALAAGACRLGPAPQTRVAAAEVWPLALRCQAVHGSPQSVGGPVRVSASCSHGQGLPVEATGSASAGLSDSAPCLLSAPTPSAQQLRNAPPRADSRQYTYLWQRRQGGGGTQAERSSAGHGQPGWLYSRPGRLQGWHTLDACTMLACSAICRLLAAAGVEKLAQHCDGHRHQACCSGHVHHLRHLVWQAVVLQSLQQFYFSLRRA